MTDINPEKMREYLRGFEEDWVRRRNPVDVWAAVAICRLHKVPFPNWVMDYLEECAKRVLEARTQRTRSGKEDLRIIFGFQQATGRGGYFRHARAKVAREMLAMAFAAAIFAGASPLDARRQAEQYMLMNRQKWYGPKHRDAKTLRSWFRSFYGVSEEPMGTAGWRTELVKWFSQEIEVLLFYADEHHNLPTIPHLTAEYAAVQGLASLTLRMTPEGKMVLQNSRR